MKSEKQIKKCAGKTFQSRPEEKKSGLADNRPNTILQHRLINSIQNSNKGLFPIRKINKPLLDESPIATGESPVQRAIGFEFEVQVPLYTKEKSQTKDTTFQKQEKLHDQDEFHIVQDYASQKIEGIQTIPEFVIHPADENLSIDDFLKNTTAAYNYIKASRPIKKMFENTFIGTSSWPFNINKVTTGQATFGIRPEGMEELFIHKREKVGRLTSLFETDILGKAVGAANIIMQDPIFKPLSESPEKLKVKGYILLICQYCASNSLGELQFSEAIDKNKVPFLVRSPLGAIAKATLSAESLSLLANNKEDLADKIIELTGAHRDYPVILPTKAEKAPKPNVEVSKWLDDVLSASDAPLNWGSETDGSDSLIINPEKTGPDGAMGAVLEERNLTLSPTPVDNWMGQATQIWETVRQANIK